MSNLKHYRERRSQDRRSRLHIMGGASISDHKQSSEATPPALWATRLASVGRYEGLDARIDLTLSIDSHAPAFSLA